MAPSTQTPAQLNAVSAAAAGGGSSAHLRDVTDAGSSTVGEDWDGSRGGGALNAADAVVADPVAASRSGYPHPGGSAASSVVGVAGAEVVDTVVMSGAAGTAADSGSPVIRQDMSAAGRRVGGARGGLSQPALRPSALRSMSEYLRTIVLSSEWTAMGRNVGSGNFDASKPTRLLTSPMIRRFLATTGLPSLDYLSCVRIRAVFQEVL